MFLAEPVFESFMHFIILGHLFFYQESVIVGKRWEVECFGGVGSGMLVRGNEAEAGLCHKGTDTLWLYGTSSLGQ